LLRVDASFRGQLSFTQTPGSPVAEVAGDVGLEDFKANSLVPSEDLLAWKVSILRGLKVALAPAKPTQVDARETVLTDFFVRVIVAPEVRINLQDLLKPAANGATATSTGASGVNVVSGNNGSNGSNTQSLSSTVNATKSIATDDLGSGATGLNDVKNAVSVVGVAAAAQPVINFGPISLVNGSVRFSNRFVKPNYSADLTELTGKLSAFSSLAGAGTPLLADRNAVVDLDLPISGSLNESQFSLGPGYGQSHQCHRQGDHRTF